jgi:hypothetical protein
MVLYRISPKQRSLGLLQCLDIFELHEINASGDL